MSHPLGSPRNGGLPAAQEPQKGNIARPSLAKKWRDEHRQEEVLPTGGAMVDITGVIGARAKVPSEHVRILLHFGRSFARKRASA
jgi:hypothetical protein